jgi:uncharacterized membrane protein
VHFECAGPHKNGADSHSPQVAVLGSILLLLLHIILNIIIIRRIVRNISFLFIILNVTILNLTILNIILLLQENYYSCTSSSS